MAGLNQDFIYGLAMESVEEAYDVVWGFRFESAFWSCNKTCRENLKFLIYFIKIIYNFQI